MNELCIRYLESFIEILTAQKDTCFYALTNLDYEFLELVSDKVDVKSVYVQKVSRKDFGLAIKLRNNAKVRKIVLLSAESIKRMESLKDFIEIKTFDNIELFFNSIYKTFDIKLKYNPNKITLVEKYIKTIISEQKNSLVEILEYFQSCKKNEVFDESAINQNLPILGIWSLSPNDSGIGKLRRAIRFSDNSNFDKIIQDIDNDVNNTFNLKEKKALLKITSIGEFKDAFKMISFERIDNFVKNNRIAIKKRIQTKTEINEVEKNNSEQYFFSYEYLLDKNLDEIDNIENIINKDLESDESDFENFTAAIEAARYYEISNYDVDINLINFIKIIERSNISEIKRKEIEYSINDIVSDYKAVNKVPVTLKCFCDESFKYCQSYFMLMCKFITDEEISPACYMNDIIESLLLIFSQEDKNGIHLSYKHPISIFYYLCIKSVYEQAITLNKNLNEKYEFSLNGLIERFIFKFPIEILKFNNRNCYYNNNVQSIPFEITFRENPIGISQSKVGFKSISKYLSKYVISKEFYTPEIKVCILGDVLPQSFGYLLKSISNDEPLNKTNFLFEFICSNENMIKDAIEESLENQSLIRNSSFKFTGYKFISDMRSLDIGKIIKNNDITFISNSSILYNDGFFQKNSQNTINILNLISTFNLKQAVESNVNHNFNLPNFILDTLQARINNSENGIYTWQNSTLNNNNLLAIISETKNDKSKAAVIFSSDLNINKKIYNGLFEPEVCEERGNKSLGIYFNGNIKNKALEVNGTNFILFSFTHLIQTIILESEVNSTLKKIFSIENVNYKDMKIKIEIINNLPTITVILEDNSEEKYVETEGVLFLNFVKEIWGFSDNVLSIKIREVIIDLLQGYCTNYSQCLLVDFLKTCSNLVVSENFIVESVEFAKDTYVTATKEVFDLIDFINFKQVIDEMSLSYISKNFKLDVIKYLCETINTCEFADVNLRKKGIEILRKLGQ